MRLVPIRKQARTGAVAMAALILVACGEGTGPLPAEDILSPVEGIPAGMKVYEGFVRFDQSIGNLMLLVDESWDADPDTRPAMAVMNGPAGDLVMLDGTYTVFTGEVELTGDGATLSGVSDGDDVEGAALVENETGAVSATSDETPPLLLKGSMSCREETGLPCDDTVDWPRPFGIIAGATAEVTLDLCDGAALDCSATIDGDDIVVAMEEPDGDRLAWRVELDANGHFVEEASERNGNDVYTIQGTATLPAPIQPVPDDTLVKTGVNVRLHGDVRPQLAYGVTCVDITITTVADGVQKIRKRGYTGYNTSLEAVEYDVSHLFAVTVAEGGKVEALVSFTPAAGCEPVFVNGGVRDQPLQFAPVAAERIIITGPPRRTGGAAGARTRVAPTFTWTRLAH